MRHIRQHVPKETNLAILSFNILIFTEKKFRTLGPPLINFEGNSGGLWPFLVCWFLKNEICATVIPYWQKQIYAHTAKLTQSKMPATLASKYLRKWNYLLLQVKFTTGYAYLQFSQVTWGSWPGAPQVCYPSISLRKYYGVVADV